MVLIKKSRCLPHFLKDRKKDSNGSFHVSQDIIKTNVTVSLQGPATGSHPKVPSQGPTLRSHPRVQPQSPTLGSQPKVSPQGPTLGSHPGVPPQSLGFWGPPQGLRHTFPVCCKFIEIALRNGCSPVNLLHIFRTLFPKNNSEGLLLLTQKQTKKTLI